MGEPAAPSWERVTKRTGLPPVGGRFRLIAPDIDGDCARDLVLNTARGLRVFRNRRNASFEDLTAQAGLPESFVLSAAGIWLLMTNNRSVHKCVPIHNKPRRVA